MGARGATGFALTVGSEVFEESGRSLVRGTLDYLQGLKVFTFLSGSLSVGVSICLSGHCFVSDAWSKAH